jgi:hypothetical protein
VWKCFNEDIMCQSLPERRLKTRLHIFYKIINNKIAVPYDNILIPSQSRTRSTHSKTIRQIKCNKDSFKVSFLCRTIKDWNKLPEHIVFGPVRFYRCFRWYMGPRQSSSILVWVVQEIGMLSLLQILN